uniref:GPI transamidase component PIG-S n=1 Tax=Pristiophorus japonicus TaxID=55135 RepID=UPI00398EE9A7
MAAAGTAEEKLRGKYSANCITVMVILAGLPLWWKTTETYRAALPYTQISELDFLLLDISVPVEVVFARGTLTAEQQKKLLPQTQFSQKVNQLDDKTGFKYRYEKTYRAATGIEQDALMGENVEGAVDTLSRVYESPAGSVVIYVVAADSQLLPQEFTVYIGKHRAVFLRSPVTGSHSAEDVLQDIDDSVEEILQTVSFTDDMVVAALSSRVPSGTFGTDTFTDSMTAFKSSLGRQNAQLLLGIPRVQPPPETLVQNPGNMIVTDWETDRLLWVRTVENIGTATNTLTSLAQLLDEIGNIVINDNIASEVYSAVASVQRSLDELEAGRLLPAFQAGKEAITSSERAFFDPSLLHLLYFPDDQKFAIYIPLFLPMCVPIMLSLLKTAKNLRWRRKVD